jgi:uncharacterized phage protein (TIGR01671 family)
MTREIKFRAFDTLNNVMKHWYYIAAKFDISDLFDSSSRFVAMQYTGLKDKHGVEIYEGDIFKYTHHVGYLLRTFISEVIYIEEWACFGYKIREELLGERDVPFSEHDELKNDFLDYVEVIGNIYETPSLLTQNNDNGK